MCVVIIYWLSTYSVLVYYTIFVNIQCGIMLSVYIADSSAMMQVLLV